LLAVGAVPAGAEEGPGLMSPSTGLMFWTLLIFITLFLILRKWAFPVIISAVEAREKALEDAIQSAKRDREEAALLLAEHRAALDASRGEGQKLIAEARVAAERVRAELVTQAQKEQAEMLARARAEIQTEKNKAVAELRREAVDLAIRGASKVIEKNLDQPTNRQLVESFLASVSPTAVKASR
ncbi:MAG TPA: F0F1 ATP synthase subunit B, partial [Usitatibacter sp.]